MKLYKKLAATLCLLVSTTSFCSGMQSFYDLGNENWSLYENNPKSQAANDGIKNALIYWNLSCSQQEPDCEEAQKKLGFLYNHQDSHVRFIVGVYNWEQYAIKEGEEKKEFLESALNHLVFSSNLNHPEAQKQIQTIKSQNDSVYQLPLSQIYYNQGNFDEGFSFLCTLLKAGNEEARSRMIEIFDKSPEAVKHFHQSIGKLEAEFVHNNPGSRCGDLIQAILPFSRPFLGALLDVKPDLAEQLDDHTQKNIGARYANALHGLEKGDLQKRYADQAMRYNILSAKQGNKDAQNDLLIRIMIINTNGQEIFYKHLLPLLEAGDEQAQNLFNQFCLQEINDYRTRSIYDYFSSIASQLFKDKSNPGLLKVLDHVIQSYESFRSQKNGGTLSLLNLSNVALSPADTEYQAAMELLKESPHDALGRLREAEKLGSEEAKAKLAEIRNSQGYKVPHKAEENDPSHLLKKDDETESLRLFNHFDTHFSKRIKKHEFSQKEIGEAAFILYQAAELGNLAAKTEVKRLKKSQGYKDAQKRPGSTSTDPYYRLARNFYGLEGVQAHLKGEVNNSSSAQGGGAQKSPETPSVQRRGKKGGRRNRKTASQSLSAQKGGRDAHNNTTSSSTSTNLQRKTKQGSTTTPTTTTSATQKERTPEDILNLAQQCLYKNNIEEAKQYLNDAVPSVSAEAEEPNTTTSQKSSKPKSFSSPSNGESIRDEDEKEKKHKTASQKGKKQLS